MKIGVFVPNELWDDSDIFGAAIFHELLVAADETAVDSIWMADDVYADAGDTARHPRVFDAWSMVGYISGIVRNVAVGVHEPAGSARRSRDMLRAVHTLDELTWGRALLGIDAVWTDALLRSYHGSDVLDTGGHADEASTPWNGGMELLGKAVRTQIPSFLLVRESAGADGATRAVEDVEQSSDEGADGLSARGHGVQLELAPRLHVPRYTTIDMLLTRDGREGSTSAGALLEYLSTLAHGGVEQCVLKFPNIREGEPFEVIRDSIMPYIDQV